MAASHKRNIQQLVVRTEQVCCIPPPTYLQTNHNLTYSFENRVTYMYRYRMHIYNL